jgi:hypothetical protein
VRQSRSVERGQVRRGGMGDRFAAADLGIDTLRIYTRLLSDYLMAWSDRPPDLRDWQSQGNEINRMGRPTNEKCWACSLLTAIVLPQRPYSSRQAATPD